MFILTHIPQNRFEDVSQEVITEDEAQLIFAAINKAEKDIAEINETLDQSQKRAEEFFAAIKRLRDAR